MRLLSCLCSALLLLSACKDAPDPADSGDSGDSAPPAEGFTEAQRVLVEDAVFQFSSNAAWVGLNAGVREVPFATSLLGAELSHVGVASMFFACDEAITYDAYCEPSWDISGVNTCTRMSCEAPGVWGALAWLSTGGADPEARAPLSYPATLVDGEVQWQESPLSAWQMDHNGDEVEITGETHNQLTVALDEGAALDLSHSAAASISSDHGSPSRFDLSLSFGALFPGQALLADLRLDEAAHVTGEITLDGEVVAEISQGDAWIEVSWVE